MPEITHRKKRLSSFKLIVLGFAGVILLGALILMLPFCYAVSRGAVHIDLGRLRYGAGCAGYGQLLVRFRADGNTADDPDRRAWCCDSCGIFRYAVRQKNIADAAQYHAGRHLCPEGRRDRPPDPLYCTGNFFDRAYRNDRHAADILRKLRY